MLEPMKYIFQTFCLKFMPTFQWGRQQVWQLPYQYQWECTPNLPIFWCVPLEFHNFDNIIMSFFFATSYLTA